MKKIYLSNKNHFGQVFKIISVFFLFGSLLGCATGSTIVTGTKKSPISSDEVKIYLDPPAEYESIGLIEVSSGIVFSRQAAMNEAMKEIKSKAAKIGANGVLLTNTGSKSGGTTGYYSNGIYIGGDSSDKILAQGRAIYVIRE
ncbi:MAG: hypothetical protein PHY69_11070 [Dysgonamonadaceae bacterium]|jgi:hypothetical protein|nr:hypothetical protein [Dysgonamonadaceae bacterium]